MAQKMTEENKPFVMATLSEVAYKDLEEASKTFEQFRFTEHKYIDRDGAQCYLIWNDDDAVVIFRGTEPKQWSEQQNEVILYYEKAVRKEPEIVEEDLDG